MGPCPAFQCQGSSYGLYSHGLYSHGVYGHGPYSYGLLSDGLHSYGLCSYGRMACECQSSNSAIAKTDPGRNYRNATATVALSGLFLIN